MDLSFLHDRFDQVADRPALVSGGATFTYRQLGDAIAQWRSTLRAENLRQRVVTLEADFSPNAAALLLALWEESCIVVPLTETVEAQKPLFRRIAQAETIIRIDERDGVRIESTGAAAAHPLYDQLREPDHGGLVIFTSGSTGQPKAAVHDAALLLQKFRVRRKPHIMLSFLLFDHIGGINTLLHTLSNGGCLVTLRDRSPDSVAAAIETHGIEVLPATPTFLNLLLLSEAHRRHDLSSLRVISYGTEPMPEQTLLRIREGFPSVALHQMYGMSEVGILRSKPKSSDSLLVKVGGESIETRVVDGLLEIRGNALMLGYLNAPSPFTDDGWLQTGDAVKVDGEYLRILGRRSEIINVGGEKVYPAEVEGVLEQMPGVIAAAVTGEPNAITGNIVTARVALTTTETPAEFRARMRGFCKDKLPRFKVPQKVTLATEPLHGSRFKKTR